MSVAEVIPPKGRQSFWSLAEATESRAALFVANSIQLVMPCHPEYRLCNRLSAHDDTENFEWASARDTANLLMLVA